MNDFGNYLFMLRKEKGYTQAELAEKLGVTNKAVSKWETGEAFPETAQLIPLADIFGVTADELLRGRATGEEKTAFDSKAPEQNSAAKNAEEIARKYHPEWWHKKFAVLIVCGVAFVVAGVIALIAAGLVIESENLLILISLLFLAAAGAGVDLFIYAGITSQNAFLPVCDDSWQKKLVSFRTQMILGMTFVVSGVIGILAACLFDEGAQWQNKTAFVTVILGGFVLLAAGVFFFIYGGIVWDSYRERVVAEKRAMQAKGMLGKEESEALLAIDKKKANTSLSERINSVIMLLATIIFLLLGVVKGLWHPGWVVFPVGGLLCAVTSIIFRSKN